MSTLHIVFEGKQSPEKVSVHGVARFIIPFIGVKEHSDYSRKRGIGVHCPGFDKRIFQAFDSIDPHHYLRAFTMMSNLPKFTDELVRDCIVATAINDKKRQLEQFAKTSAAMKMGVRQQERVFEAQLKACTFEPSAMLIARIAKGFKDCGAPLTQEEPVKPQATVIVIREQVLGPSLSDLSEGRDVCPIEHSPKAKGGGFYKPLGETSIQAATA